MSTEPTIDREKAMATDRHLTETEAPSQTGLIIGIAIIVLALGFIGWYVWNQMNPTPTAEIVLTPSRPTAEENNEPESTTAEAQTEVLQVMSTSDELPLINADLESTKLDGIDAELTAIDAELSAALR